jgi:hypothetical protein
MVLIGIINNFIINKTDILLLNHSMIIPDILPFNPYVVTGSLVFGYFYVEWIFFYLLWQYIRPIREKIKEVIKRCLTKKRMRFS